MYPPIRRACLAVVFAACALGLSGPGPAFGQSNFYYGGGTRTWSNSASWWQSYLATPATQAGNPPGALDTAIFNVSGSNAAGTAVFDSDTSIAGLRLLPTADGGLTLRGDGVADRTLTIGAGGIRTLAGNASALTIGSSSTNQGLNVVIGANQEWRRRTGSLAVLNNVMGSATTGATQTLVASAPLSTGSFGGLITDGTNGGRTNLWLTVKDYGYINRNSTLTGTLTVQATNYGGNQGSGIMWSGLAASQSGTLAVAEFQIAGGSLWQSYLTLSGSSIVRMLGGAANMSNSQSRLFQSGTFVREKGGGFLAASASTITGIANDINLNGVIPWGFEQTTGVMGPLRYSAGELTNSIPGSVYQLPTTGTPLSSNFTNPTMNYTGWGYLGRTAGANVANTGGPIEYVSNNLAGSLFYQVPAWYLDLNASTWTANGITTFNGATTELTVASSGGGGGVVIGASGELILATAGGTNTFTAPIRESVAGSWVTYGAVYKSGVQGFGILNLSGSNSHTGGTSLVSGTANINNAFALGSGTFRINGNNIVLNNTTNGPLTIATNNFNEWNTDFRFQGTQDLNLGTGTVSLGTWAGSTRTVTVDAGTLTVGGRIVDGSFSALPTNSIAKDGNGTLILSGSNGYTGATEVWGGDLRFANRSALYGADTSKWTAANITTGSGGVISVSVGSGAGAFTTTDLNTLAAVGSDLGGYLGIDTTNVGGTYTYATSLADPAGGERVLGIAKAGTGTLILSGTNTFTGGVLARGGRLLVTATNQVGPGTLVAAGGLLDLNGLTVSNSFSITSGTIANTTINAGKLTAAVTGPAVISGTLTGAAAGFTKSGTGTLVLTSNNDYTGTTTVSGGLLSIASDANIGGTAAPLTFSGGGLQVTGTALTSLSTNRTTTFTSNQPVTFEIVDPANTFTVSQNLQMGSGGLTKSGSGTLVASGNNTYTGATTLTGGSLRMGSATAIGAAASPITVSGGVLDLNGNSVSRSGTTTFAGGLVTGGTLTSTVAYAAQSGTVAVSLAGAVALTKSGTGVLVLSGSNSYSGVTTVNSTNNLGILQFANPAALYGATTGSWTKTNIVVNSGATLAVNVGGTGEFDTNAVTTLLTGISGTVTNNGLVAGSFIGFDTTNSGTAFTVADVIANTAGTGGGAVGLAKLGAGTLILSASNTFTGLTAVGYYNGPSAGTLQLASTGYVSPTVVVYGGTFDTAGQNRAITTLSLGGGAPGSTASLQTGSGTATLGSNGITYVAINSSNGATIGGNLSLGGTNRTFLVNDSPAAAADLTVSAVISEGAAAGGLIKSGYGTLALTGSNTFTGKTAITQGTVQIDWINGSGASPLGANTTTDLGSGPAAGTLRWVGATSGTLSRTLNLSGSTGGGGIEASGAGALVVTSTVTATGAGAKTLILGGTSTAANTIGQIGENSITNATSVVKDGPGLWRLTTSSTFSGGFTLRNGTVIAEVNSGAANGQAGVFGTANIVTVGDASAGATGVAALLVAPGVRMTKTVSVPATTGVQAVLLGSSGAVGATGVFDGIVRLDRAVTLVAVAGGTTNFSNSWRDATGTGTPGANVSVGTAAYPGTVLLGQNLTTTGTVGVRYGTLRLAGGTATLGRTTPVSIGAAGGGAVLDLNGTLQPLANLSFAGDGGTLADLAGGGGLVLNGAGSTVAVGVTGTGHAISAPVSLDDAATFTIASQGRLVIGSVVANGTSGPRGLTKAGVGTLELGGGNTFTGPTTVGAGTLVIGSGGTTGALALASAITGSAGGTLAFNRSNAVVQGTDFATAIGGAVNVAQFGSGTLSLTGANAYTGTTSVLAGTLRIGNGATAGSVPGTGGLVLGGGRLVLDRSDVVTQAFAGTVVSGAAAAAANAGNTVDFGALTRLPGGALDVSSTGAFITSSPNVNGILAGVTYGGTTWAVANGASPITGLASYTLTSNAVTDPANYLAANVDVNSSPSLTGPIAAGSLRFATAAATTLGLSGASTVAGGILVTPGVGGNASAITGGSLAGVGGDLAVVQNNTEAPLTIGAVIADGTAATGLTKAGAGLLALTAANTYTAATTISAGTLALGAGGATGSVAGDIVNNATLAFNRSDAVTYAGVVSGAGNLVKQAGGTVRLTGASTYTGTTSIDAGVLQVGTGGVAGSIASSAAITGSAGGTLAFNRSNAVVQGTDFPGTIGGAIGLTQAGPGTLTLTTANTYTGTTSVNAGTLQIGSGTSGGSIASSAAITGSAGGALAFNRSTALVQGTDFPGLIAGAISLTQSGPGALTLSGTNTFTGPTRAAAGRINVSGALAIQNSTLDMNAADSGTVALGQNSTVGGLTGSRNLDLGGVTLSVGNNGTNTTYSGVLSGGALTKVGAGMLTLTGSHTYAGATTISGGTLSIGDGGTTGSIAGNIVNNATLAFNRSDSFAFAGAVSGTGSLLKQGAGTLTLTGSSTFTGPTTVAGGLLVVPAAATIGGQSVVNLDGGTLSVGQPTNGNAMVFNGGTLRNAVVGGFLQGTGGDSVVVSNGNVIQTFSTVGTSSLTMPVSSTAQVLVVGGGGGGGKAEPNPWGDGAGGGGAGGLIFNNAYTLMAGATYTVTVGGGGVGSTITTAKGGNGSNSVFDSLIAVGGGGGGSDEGVVNGANKGANGGSGGGAASYATGTPATESATAGGTGTPTQGNNGGGSNQGLSSRGGGGGGGAGTAGTTATTNAGGAGGSGLSYSISGSSVFYAGGGGGGANNTASVGAGGQGGGGAGGNNGGAGANATANTGGGGGGGASGSGSVSGTGGNGGSGIVIVSYPAVYQSSILTLTGSIQVAANSTLDDAGGGIVVQSTMAGLGGIIKTGTGTLTLSSSNSYSGTTTVSAGSLFLGHAQALGKSTFAGGAGSLSFGGLTAATFGGLAGSSALALSNTAAGSVGLSVGANDQNSTYSGILSGGGSLTKIGAGRLTLSGSSTFSGPTTVSAGLLAVDGRLASGVTVQAGGMLGGSGRVASTLGGAGLVAPGNSPGILTADVFDPTGGLDLAFEFTGTAPLYTTATSSINDVLRLTGTAPFTAALSPGINTVSLYLPASAATGGTFEGGFFTDLTQAAFGSFASLATSGSIVAYYQSGSGTYTYNGLSYALLSELGGASVTPGTTTVASAGFSDGTVSGGQVTTFTVVVPEPGAVALVALGLGLAGYALRRRRVA